jgi:transcriptional regulator with XRE-family HTH domain
MRNQVARKEGPEQQEWPRSKSGQPDVGKILQRLRTQRRLTLRQVAEGSGVSPSFLGAVERGESDIALGRLARVAAFFGHDVGSLLGYSSRGRQLQFIQGGDRFEVSRGAGVRYEVVRLPGLGFELILVDLAPGAGFEHDLAHEGVDVMLVTKGDVVVTLDGEDHTVRERECVVWSGGYPHRVRNDTDEPASEIGICTERMY